MNEYGAAIERGEVAEASADGYRVRSMTREGITTPIIPAIGDAEYAVGDRVYFFIFEDGHGAILTAFD